MRLAAILAVAGVSLAAPVQDKKIECKLKRIEITGGGSQWNVDVTLDHTLPDRSVFLAQLRVKRHNYNWFARELTVSTEPVPSVRAEIPATGKTAKTPRRDVITTSSPGYYELVISFDPERQKAPNVPKDFKDRYGKFNYYKHEFAPIPFMVGDNKKILAALRADTEDCLELIRKCRAFMDRIERESEAKDWPERAAAIFKELDELRIKTDKKAQTSLHAATYRMIAQILEQLRAVGAKIQMMKSAEKAGGNDGGKNPTEDDEPVTEHKDASKGAIIAGLDGRKLSLAKMKELINLCDIVRHREYLSWITLIHQVAMDQVDAAYESAKKKEPDSDKLFAKTRGEVIAWAEEIEKTFKYMMDSSQEKFEPWTIYPLEGKDQKYEAFLKLFTDYVDALAADQATPGETPQTVLDARTKLRAHHEAARNRIMGKKKS